jgi:group I intron endonuclease
MPQTKTTEEFIKEAKEIFGDLYDYSITVYKGARKPIEYICKVHGKVIQSYATNHLRGKGCSKCRISKGAKTRTKSYDSFLKKAKIIHNNLYEYPKTGYVNRKTKIIILCKRCNESFLQTPENHLEGKGCNSCNRKKSTWQKDLLKKNFRKLSKKYMFVYRTTNLVNGKIYIGQHSTNNLKDGYKGSGLLISKAFKKYGKDNFKFEIIKFSDSREYLDQLEKKLIDEHNALDNEIGYNIHQGGLGGSSFKKINQYKLDGTFIKTWDAIIIASDELNLSCKTIQNCAKGLKPSCGGYMWKDYNEFKECKNIEGFVDNSKKTINQYNLEGKFIKTWNSISEAASTLNLNNSSIGKCCRMEASTHQMGGFIWRYLDDVKNTSDIPPIKYKSKKYVEQYTLDGEYLNTFNSVSEASRSINSATTNISKCCNGKRKSARGYVWKYKNYPWCICRTLKKAVHFGY